MSGRQRWTALLCIAVAGILAYSNSFQGPFVLDDEGSITANPHIRQLWPIWEAMASPPQLTVSGRPILALSLAVNYAISGLRVWSYHALNLAVHILAALVLFGIVRRTLLSSALRRAYGSASFPLALTSALVWLVHPLQTQAVTYVIQRAESLMGLFYLATLYCVIRGVASPGSSRSWYAAAVLLCGLGMGTKEVMASAPILVLIYDRVFVSSSFAEALQRRRGLHAGLAATWLILAGLASTTPRSGSVGFEFLITPWQYATTQCNVIVLYYLKPALWPHPLIFDYGWPIARHFSDYAAEGVVLALAAAATGLALWRRPALGFLGAWFFLILAPTSSFLPIVTEIAAEHRMYLPLAAVVVGLVVGAYEANRKLKAARGVGYALAALVVLALGFLTFQRNQVYRTAETLWRDTVSKVPGNGRAHTNLAACLSAQGKVDEAMRHCSEALRIEPRDPAALNGRGVAHIGKGEYDAAIRDLDRAIELDPGVAFYYNNRGSAYAKKGLVDRAIADFDRSIEIAPEYINAYNNRAIAYANQGRYELAIHDFDRTLELDPGFTSAYNHRGVAYRSLSDYKRALRDFDRAIELDRDYASAFYNRALTHVGMGNYDQAAGDGERALRLAQAGGQTALAGEARHLLDVLELRRTMGR